MIVSPFFHIVRRMPNYYFEIRRSPVDLGGFRLFPHEKWDLMMVKKVLPEATKSVIWDTFYEIMFFAREERGYSHEDCRAQFADTGLLA